MTISIKKQNLFMQYLHQLKSVTQNKSLNYATILELVLHKQKENISYNDIDDTFTTQEYISYCFPDETDETKLHSIYRASLTSFKSLSKEKELSDFLKSLLPYTDHSNQKLSLKNYLKSLYGDNISTTIREEEYDRLSTEIYDDFIEYCIDNEIEKPTLQPLLKSWKVLVNAN